MIFMRFFRVFSFFVKCFRRIIYLFCINFGYVLRFLYSFESMRWGSLSVRVCFCFFWGFLFVFIVFGFRLIKRYKEGCIGIKFFTFVGNRCFLNIVFLDRRFVYIEFSFDRLLRNFFYIEIFLLFFF